MSFLKIYKDAIIHDICAKMGYYHKIAKKEIEYCIDLRNDVIVYSYKEIKNQKLQVGGQDGNS